LSDTKKNKWEYWQDLPPDKEDELIEKIALSIDKNNLEFLSLMVLEVFGPISNIFAELSLGIFGPFLEIFGLDTLVAFFRKKGNFERLMDKINKNEEKKKTSK